MFKVDINYLEKVLTDFGITAKIQTFIELQRYNYEEREYYANAVRLIVKVELINHIPVVIRFKNEPEVTIELIENQSQFAYFLQENGIETPKQLRHATNYAKYYSIGNYDVIVTVEEFVEGELQYVDVEIAKETGRLLAKTHNLSEKANYHVKNQVMFDPLQENELFSVVEFQGFKEQLMIIDPDLFEKINQQYKKCLNKISVFQDNPRYAVQGDISDCNLYRTNDGKIGMFDFNRCGDNNLYFDAIMQAIFEARLMNYPTHYLGKSEGLILPAFLKGYNSERPFSDVEKKLYPYLYAIINAFWSEDIIWNENSLRHSIEADDKESIRACMQEIHRRIHTLPEIPVSFE